MCRKSCSRTSGKARARADAVEVPVQAPRLDRRADGRREHEAEVVPGVVRVDTLLGLPLAVLDEDAAGDLRQRHRGVGGFRLGVVDEQLPGDPLDGLRDGERRAVEVEVFPAQAQQLPAAKAERRGDDVQRVEPGRLGFAEDLLHIRHLEALADLVARGRDLHELGDVARDQLVALGAAQRVPQDGVHELDLPRGRCSPAALPDRAALLVVRPVLVVAVEAAEALARVTATRRRTSAPVSLSSRILPSTGRMCRRTALS